MERIERRLLMDSRTCIYIFFCLNLFYDIRYFYELFDCVCSLLFFFFSLIDNDSCYSFLTYTNTYFCHAFDTDEKRNDFKSFGSTIKRPV
jgi:hypothetical protein